MRFDELKAKWNWKPMHSCPGRYILLGVDGNLSPEDLLGHEVQLSEFRVDKAKDTVVVAKLGDGGLISYKKIDGTYLHTLNSVTGFERKLLQLRIELNPCSKETHPLPAGGSDSYSLWIIPRFSTRYFAKRCPPSTPAT